MLACRICDGRVEEFCDFGRQPLSDAFLGPDGRDDEYFFRLAVGVCSSCAMVQLVEEVPRTRMFHEDYPYRSSGSTRMRRHFERTAEELLAGELSQGDPFIVEIGCNDGIMLKTISRAGVRHLGVEPSGGVAQLARADGVRVTTEFFQESSALTIRKTDGAADVVYAANTVCHIPYMDSIFRGVDALLGPDGVFVFEDPYLGDVIDRTSFDQIYDEHFYLFSVTSVDAMARRFGFELVNAERLPVHGGEVRYTLARKGRRPVAREVHELLAEEERRGLATLEVLRGFAERARGIRERLVALLRELRAAGKTVAGYGATAKSATVLNYCGIGPDLLPYISDTTPTKQGRLTPGSHIPVRTPDSFADPYPDYALLFAWNHSEEIMAKEQRFRQEGGKWILYVPDVRIV
ncbi:class I SAM-dependent methyltransferase [Thermobifida alba]|uniref:Class I SAM-dependent methyltransferase n=1 Tax=Thermobifida alba TaxID=53522 RepID=A0ABY4KZG7_THEAE|nr:class I SAM-dependent methyltransferase [Thermobifida alba]UPT20806.1 class I SAM-dependent methyltransferase [Thermobifida alba]